MGQQAGGHLVGQLLEGLMDGDFETGKGRGVVAELVKPVIFLGL